MLAARFGRDRGGAGSTMCSTAMLWLIQRQLKSKKTASRRKAVERLCDAPHPRALGLLHEALDDEDAEVRRLTAQAAQAPAGCDGVFWLPYLTGERTPHADPMARAGWIGIHSGTGRKELIRSVMEGATFAMNDTVHILRDERGLPIKQIRLSGGGARSSFWRQLQADIYGTQCVTINAEEGPAYGVALLAAAWTLSRRQELSF